MAATADANINLTDVDFVGIKDSLKKFIGAKQTFKDHNFDGSAMSTLLDVLAYNTHYQAFYANMVANEMFLDSAVVRDSVVSHAKALGYTPNSTKAPKALVDVVYPNFDSVGDSVILPKGTVFKGRLGDLAYNFCTTEPWTLDVETTPVTARSIPIYEGSLRAMTFVYDTNNSDQKFIIPQQQVDITHLSVNVQKSSTNNSGFADVWTLATDINVIESTTKTYWIQEVKNGYYEVYFGDGVVGKALEDGNLIVLEYLVTNGSDANGIGSSDSSDNRAFTISSANAYVEVVSGADGGGVRETLKNIKYYAPRAYQTQDRAVTAEDYKTVINREYPTADSVYVWGGEDHEPPEYGKIFVSVKPKTGLLLTQEEKNYLTNTILKKKNLVAISPEIRDPEYLFIKFDITTTYDENQVNENKAAFIATLKDRVINWSNLNLGKFNQNYRHSKLTTEVDGTSNSILNTVINTKMQKRIQPSLTHKTNYDIKFYNEFFHPHEGHMSILSTTPFVYKDIDGTTDVKCYMDDDGNGLIRMYKVIDGVKNYINKNVGTINYVDGEISLKQFQPTALSDNYITLRFTVAPKSPTITALRNNIVYFDQYDNSALIVNLISETMVVGHSTTKTSSSSSSSTGY